MMTASFRPSRAGFAIESSIVCHSKTNSVRFRYDLFTFAAKSQWIDAVDDHFVRGGLLFE